MTKNIFIVAIAVLLSVAFCSLSAQNVSKDYNVDEFSAINLQSVGNIIFTQSAGCSLSRIKIGMRGISRTLFAILLLPI